MLIPVQPKSTVVPSFVSVPRSLAPLVAAANAGNSLYPPIQKIMRTMGFCSFMYGATTGRTLRRDERFFIWTTAPAEWVIEYDQNSYVEIDPRVAHAWAVLPPPLIWDSRISNGDSRVQFFLERAAAHGLGSGIAIYLHDYTSKVLVCLSQPQRMLSTKRRAQLAGWLGDAVQLATIFHNIFMKDVIENGLMPVHHGSPLSARERQCLQLAARGMTSFDIGLKLAITERTVNFHFSNIISKMGVLNRLEAIAMGVAHGLIQVDPRAAPLKPLRASKIRDAQLKRWEALRNKGQQQRSSSDRQRNA
jgi:DNA-binding CsgD family transcriptional regulator